MTDINLVIVNKEQIKDWIWCGILYHNLDTKIIDAILLDVNVNEDDKEKYDFAHEILAKSSEIYFKLGIEVSKLI